MAKPFPTTLLDFQRMFPDERACGNYLERVRWPDGFVCPRCGAVGEAYRFENRPTVLRCRDCRRNTYLTAGTVMHATRTPLQVWFWGAYLVTTQTPGMSALQFQRQLGLRRYETAFQVLHKLRAGMVRPDRDRIGAQWPVSSAARRGAKGAAFTTRCTSSAPSRFARNRTSTAVVPSTPGVCACGY